MKRTLTKHAGQYADAWRFTSFARHVMEAVLNWATKTVKQQTSRPSLDKIIVQHVLRKLAHVEKLRVINLL